MGLIYLPGGDINTNRGPLVAIWGTPYPLRHEDFPIYLNKFAMDRLLRLLFGKSSSHRRRGRTANSGSAGLMREQLVKMQELRQGFVSMTVGK